eukprot:270578_1
MYSMALELFFFSRTNMNALQSFQNKSLKKLYSMFNSVNNKIIRISFNIPPITATTRIHYLNQFFHITNTCKALKASTYFIFKNLYNITIDNLDINILKNELNSIEKTKILLKNAKNEIEKKKHKNTLFRIQNVGIYSKSSYINNVWYLFNKYDLKEYIYIDKINNIKKNEFDKIIKNNVLKYIL